MGKENNVGCLLIIAVAILLDTAKLIWFIASNDPSSLTYNISFASLIVEWIGIAVAGYVIYRLFFYKKRVHIKLSKPLWLAWFCQPAATVRSYASIQHKTFTY